MGAPVPHQDQPYTPSPPLREPAFDTIARGTVLHRVHRAAYRVHQLNYTPTRHSPTASRFDPPVGGGAYGRIYVGDSPEAAVAETLCRDLPVQLDPQPILRAALRGRVLAAVVALDDLTVVDLTGPGLTRVGAGAWLTGCEPSEYDHTQRWAALLRAQFPAACGIKYRPRHDNNRFAWVLWSKGPDPVEELFWGVDEDRRRHPVKLDTPQGIALLEPILDDHNVVLL